MLLLDEVSPHTVLGKVCDRHSASTWYTIELHEHCTHVGLALKCYGNVVNNTSQGQCICVFKGISQYLNVVVERLTDPQAIRGGAI